MMKCLKKKKLNNNIFFVLIVFCTVTSSVNAQKKSSLCIDSVCLEIIRNKLISIDSFFIQNAFNCSSEIRLELSKAHKKCNFNAIDSNTIRLNVILSRNKEVVFTFFENGEYWITNFRKGRKRGIEEKYLKTGFLYEKNIHKKSENHIYRNIPF